jgi:hypothetical protein
MTAERPSFAPLAPLTPEPTESWSALAALVCALAVSEPRAGGDEFEVLTVLERPRGEVSR